MPSPKKKIMKLFQTVTIKEDYIYFELNSIIDICICSVKKQNAYFCQFIESQVQNSLNIKKCVKYAHLKFTHTVIFAFLLYSTRLCFTAKNHVLNIERLPSSQVIFQIEGATR